MSQPVPEYGNLVTAMYRPKPGKDAELRAVLAEHVRSLRAWGMASERPVLLLQARDGTYVEIFEWLPGAVERAHHDPRVAEIWGRFSAACDFVAAKDLPDAARPFPHFRVVEGVTV